VFGLADLMRAQLGSAYAAVLGPIWAKRRQVYLWPFLWLTLWGWAVSTAVLVALGAPGTGRGLGAFSLATQSILSMLRLCEYYPEADNQITLGMHAYQAVRRFVRRVEVEQAEQPVADPATAVVPVPLHAITFEKVCFRYPGAPHPVFDGLDLTLPAGRCTALVGLNGAGKSTLVKLLARLHEPDEGAVKVDGAALDGFPVDAWRARLAVIFQSFARFDASLADNIAFGAVTQAADTEGVYAAAEAVGVADLLADRDADGGGLSGGQWQRIALARALFALRHGASVLVLDEPTASLDARAEARFFEDFAQWTRGATVLLVSHRFSTVRRAEHIIVLDEGRVAEQGTHEALLAAEGEYARLFRLQADRFADGEG
jgi:ATP-binding cassette subfamily B protein